MQIARDSCRPTCAGCMAKCPEPAQSSIWSKNGIMSPVTRNFKILHLLVSVDPRAVCLLCAGGTTWRWGTWLGRVVNSQEGICFPFWVVKCCKQSASCELRHCWHDFPVSQTRYVETTSTVWCPHQGMVGFTKQSFQSACCARSHLHVLEIFETMHFIAKEYK